jgi:geranylgeranyl transferase type-2 subunit beta
MRFTYSALSALRLLNVMPNKKIIEYIKDCFNLDGGFGGLPGAESHAAYTFCAIAAISLLG